MLLNSEGVLSPQSTLDVLVRFFFPEKRKSFNPKEVVTVKSTVVEQSLMTTNVTHDMFKTEKSRNVELAVFFVASKIISKVKSVSTIDVHPTDTWMVITQGDKSFRMNYRTKEVELVELKGGEVSLAKFIAREKWILAGFTSGLLCVYSWDLQKRIHVLREHSTSIKSLAIHGTKPYVLSGSRDGKILLWDYGKGWHLIKTFYANGELDKLVGPYANRSFMHRVAIFGELDKGDTVEQIVFNPKDTDMFASAQDKTVKIWNLHSGECKQILSGHSDLIVCLDYLSLGDKLYLITGSQDRTAKIWDCETGNCVQTLKGHTDVVKIACFHPDLLIIITASWDGSVRLWDSTNFRLERTLDFKLGKVNSVACLKGLTRIAIGHEKGLVLADIRP
ncbi:coatomer subunit beta'-2-like [Triticum dicoccoides]|uniref:coatomer subunit beta'-2-like n=1 Tax=Triticum dicoccoides TaxID=85692 RepID=UPI00188E39C0|nr:coatomer subunit beta'-2-like [Triticum dicoccoides]